MDTVHTWVQKNCLISVSYCCAILIKDHRGVRNVNFQEKMRCLDEHMDREVEKENGRSE